jgi:hypothetical protein
MSFRKKQSGPVVIDLSGPDGNAFVLMGLASRWAKQLGRDPKPILRDMQAGDYENLLAVLDREFGEWVTFER